MCVSVYVSVSVCVGLSSSLPRILLGFIFLLQVGCLSYRSLFAACIHFACVCDAF